MFVRELQRRSDASGWGIRSIAAHPGTSHTEILANGPGRKGLFNRAMMALGPRIFQPAWQGALPTLYAATQSAAEPGGYYGPDGFLELRGGPTRVEMAPRATDEATAKELWEVSEQLTGVRYG